ncbi:hypothetical protein Acr_13g0004320 [Actinidia rufa]|uniref:Uncharacterized protein n=1 Tax=Actinidia rufa TaxID=165716 RepID=A0A7J0FK03_9ERIC|nr:hypothetical protein Acr_13g0004320 [Actinidia rufa]
MANGSSAKWDTFQGKEERNAASGITVRSVLDEIMENLNPSDQRVVVPLGHGDPSAFPCFRTTAVAEDAIVHSPSDPLSSTVTLHLSALSPPGGEKTKEMIVLSRLDG